MKLDHKKFDLIWPIPLLERAKKEADLYDVSVSQLLAAALLMIPLHHDEMEQRVMDMRAEFFPNSRRRPPTVASPRAESAPLEKLRGR